MCVLAVRFIFLCFEMWEIMDITLFIFVENNMDNINKKTEQRSPHHLVM